MSVNPLKVLWSCEDQPQCPDYVSRMQIFRLASTRTHTWTHIQTVSLNIKILLLLFQALGPSISQGLSSAVVHHPLLVRLSHSHSLAHSSSSQQPHSCNPHTGMHTVMHKVRAGMVMMNRTWGYTGSICVAPLLPSFPMLLLFRKCLSVTSSSLSRTCAWRICLRSSWMLSARIKQT